MTLLDLFCGAGGGAMGYYRAGFTEIVGVDNRPQPRYPFDFVQADALKPPFALDYFDLIHASPPCQRFSSAMTIGGKDKRTKCPDLLTPCRELLMGYPYVLENVPGAPMRIDLVLCGTMFGLKLIRHRWFEISFPVLFLTTPCQHKGTVANGDYACVVSGGGGGLSSTTYSRKDKCAEAMGIDWMTRQEMTQAIPPAYTEHIGNEILKYQF
jgi:DNA (cytosine-5)-methyltransferase 1